MEVLTPVGNRHRACDPCRKRKVKCSQQTPPCQRCNNLRLECEYSTIKSMGRPKRHGTNSSQTGHGMGSDEDSGQTRAIMSDVLNMEPLTGVFDQDFPDFGPLLPFDSNLHSVPMWPSFQEMPSAELPPRPINETTTSSPDLQIPSAASVSWSSKGQQIEAVPANKCACVEMVHRHFSLTDDNDHSFTKTLSLLQLSMASASRILSCSACFDPNNSLYGLSKNIHLLGSLMSSIASTYASFLTYQRKVARDAADRSELIPINVGQDGGVTFNLSGKDYWSLLKTIIGSEIDHLFSICTSFAERQTRTHTRGHEVCESGKPCHKDEEEQVVEEDNCPSNVDIAKSYSCFRTVEQVKAAILEAKRIVDTQGWGEVVGQQCL